MRALMCGTQVETYPKHGDDRDDQEQERNPSATFHEVSICASQNAEQQLHDDDNEVESS